MKFELKKNCLAQVVALALCGAFVSSANAAVSITGFGTTDASISDAGYFSNTTALGMSFMGREFVNHGTLASNYWLNANGVTVAIADEAAGASDLSNPLDAAAFGPLAGGKVEVSTNLGTGGGGLGWGFVETVSIPSSGHVAVTVQLTNNTGHTVTGVEWGVGFDPDQGIPASLGFETTNVINAHGIGASLTATSLDGWSVTLANTTSASAHAIAAYVGPTCCSPVNPNDVFSNPLQALGSHGFADRSINLAYDLGTIANGNSVSFGYEYIMAVPEPETYAMLLAGLGLIGFSARRRKVA